jgi:hypothetical protein
MYEPCTLRPTHLVIVLFIRPCKKSCISCGILTCFSHSGAFLTCASVDRKCSVTFESLPVGGKSAAGVRLSPRFLVRSTCQKTIWYSGTPVTRPTHMGPRVGWSCYGGDRISEVENLGVNFPPKNCTVVSLACMHDWGMHEALFLTKTVTSWKKITLGANCCCGRYQLGPLVVLQRWICSLGPKPVVAVWVPGWSRQWGPVNGN